MTLIKNSSNKKYVTILGDGSIRQKVEEGTENAVKRDYELKDGTKGVKYELVYDSLEGHINRISFKDGKYGKMLEVSIDDTTLSTNVESNFGTDLMKKLPAIKRELDVSLVPYSFKADGKTRKGVTVYQNGEKINSFFHNEDKSSRNGFPEVDETKSKNTDETKRKRYWRDYFLDVSEFLVDYIEKDIPEEDQQITEEDTDEIKIDNIPF